MTSQESTREDIVRKGHAFITMRTSPTRKQRMKSYEEVDKPHTFGHRGLDQRFIPAVCHSFEVSGK